MLTCYTRSNEKIDPAAETRARELRSEISANRSTWHKGDYTWLVVCAGILAFIAAYGIGANDVKAPR